MTLTQLMLVLRARKWLLLSIFGLFVIVGLGVNLALPKTFESKVSLVIDSKNTNPVTGAILPPEELSANLATEVEVITSRNVALKVIDKLNLTTFPDVIRQFNDQAEGTNGSIRDWLAGKLINNLEVKSSRAGSVITIGFKSRDPRLAAELANTFADSYVQTNLELKADPAKRQASWFQGRVQELKKAVEASQKQLTDFQREKGLAGADDRLDVENSRLAEISSQLVSAQAAMVDADTRLRQVAEASSRQELNQLPDMLGNPLLQAMKAELARDEGKLADLSQRYDRNHPQIKSAMAEVNELKSKLTAELNTAAGSIRKNADIARRRVVELQQTMDHQKAQILRLKQQRDQLDVLNKDVENAQHTYDAATQRAGAIMLEGQLDQSSVAILDPAVVPIFPARPRVVLNTLIAAVLGMLIALGVCLVTELQNQRVRSAADLVAAARVPLLAEIPGLLRIAVQKT